MTASTSSGRSSDPARRPGSPAQQRAGDRTLPIGFDELIKSSTLHAELAAGAQHIGVTELINGYEVTDHGLSRNRLIPRGCINRRLVRLMNHNGLRP